MAGNRNPMMRSDAVMGGKTPNMAPPARNTSLVQAPAPPARRRMMADGGMQGPSPFGGPGGPPPPMGGMQDQGDEPMGSMGAVRPEAVNYHDDPQTCSQCQHMQGSQCSVLQMQVSPQGGCTAFEGGGGGGQDQDQDQDMGQEPDMDADDDGRQQLS